MWTNDPVADAEAYMAKQEIEIDKLPVCSECDHPIMSDECYELDNGLVCPECLTNNHKRWVEDYVK